MESVEEYSATFVIIGGGIAGVSCAEYLPFYASDESIILITASPLIKAVTNVVPFTKTLFHFDVKEKSAESLSVEHKSVKVIPDTVISLDSLNHKVYTHKGNCVTYKKLCICAGAQPKLIAHDNVRVIGIRDLDSAKEFQKLLGNARRVLVVGNGGIATEVVYEVEGIEMIWAIKDKHISATFVDPGAAQFFQNKLTGNKGEEQTVIKRMKYTVSSKDSAEGGPALGPDWHANLNIKGARDKKLITLEYECEVKDIFEGDEMWPVYVELTNNKRYGCDFVVSATGVIPNSGIFTVGNENLQVAKDGGLKVNEKMETSLSDVFAAGDICSASWEIAPHWFQMRLWRQAWQMGIYAARCMSSSISGEEVIQDFCFELFSHVTKFFGYKVVLLGLYNGQTLDRQYEILLRVTPGIEYVKLVMKGGKMQGAVLIGETDLEEMCENLILNQLDLTDFGEDLLNPDIDIEDYFD